MALPLYLAQTPGEMAGNPLSGAIAYMSCHFSSRETGLSNLPQALPGNAILILDDSTPMDGHDPEQIARQLADQVALHRCQSVLLDFQRPGIGQQQKLAEFLVGRLPCPVGVSALYASELPCPVFLPPVPPDRLPEDYLSCWQGREIWLEAALDGIVLNLTASGCSTEPLRDFPENGLSDPRFHCHYSIETAADSAVFRLWRTRQDLNALLREARGITMAIGLWQELAAPAAQPGSQQRRKEPQNALPDP